ncbi:MAG: prepilin-type N-terminal cleavage/methylation domain-containing protein [Candidatus Pacebacteria bacterium]|nr:prepilin-type N-terminal cleavage/methylation domain-containing protein [Candidatus Paceibacterota bacterium]
MRKNITTTGFTIIELLIVIAIIAILAVAVIIAINPGAQFRQARNATRNKHINSIEKAILSYQIYNQGEYPPCIPDYPETASLSTCTELTPNYLSSLPEDPQEEDYRVGFRDPFSKHLRVYSEAEEHLTNKTFICGKDPIYYEGQIYQTIKVGSQCWMAENLNVGVCVDCE